MDSVRALIESLERLLTEAASTTYVDEFQVLDIKIHTLSEALPLLQGLLEDADKGRVRYEGMLVKVGSASDERVSVPHLVRGVEKDVLLKDEALDDRLLCDRHVEAYEQFLRDQEEQFEFDPWQRYSLLQEIDDCRDCSVNIRVEITLDKGFLERQFKESLAADVPQFASDLEKLHILFWTDFASFHSRITHDPLETHRTIAEWGQPCLFVCLRNADNDGSDYFKSVSTAACVHRETMETVLGQLLTAPSLRPLTGSRQSHIEEHPETVGYLPPEYWLSAQVLAQAHTGESIPEWFTRLAPFFVYSFLATVSSKVVADEDRLRFEIEREFALNLECSLAGDRVVVASDGGTTTVYLTQELLCALLDFYSVALQAKYTAINHDLIQKSVVYGTGFSFGDFFSRLDRIGRFYDFEYRHLLGDRFEQQSQNLRSFIANMVSLRQRLASLVDSLSKDLSELTIAVLATTALGIVAKVIDIETWDSLVVYGILTTPIFAYLYIAVFLLRIDNLRNLGKRAVDEFMRDVELGQQIWDFPLHTIGVEEEELDREALLEPLLYQHRINQLIAEACGVFSHALFIALAMTRDLWWLPAPKLILDSALFGRALWKRASKQSRVIYHSLVWLVTLAFAAVVYWTKYR
jgi:hypothetical protein